MYILLGCMVIKERCLACGELGEHTESCQHSSLRDERYRCSSCGATWTYIMEGERYHRYQLAYPDGVYEIGRSKDE